MRRRWSAVVGLSVMALVTSALPAAAASPSLPTGLVFERAVTHTPVLAAKVSDPDGGTVVGRFFARTAGAPGAVRGLIAGTGSAIDPEGLRLYERLITDRSHVSATLAMMARALALRGEAVFLIRDRLVPVTDWDVKTMHGEPRAYRVSVSEIGGGSSQTVLAGEVDHRDELLTDAERGDSMLICVSRARGERLVLDM